MPIVRGSELREWLVTRPVELDEGAVDSAGAAIDAYLSVRRRGDGTEVTRFEEDGISGVFTDVLASVMAGFAAIYVLGLVLSVTTWTIAGAAAGVLVVGAMVVRRRRPRFAPHALGVLASAVGSVVLAVAAVVYERVM